MHLAECARLAGKELQAELTEDDIKFTVGEGKFKRATLDPFYWCAWVWYRTSDGEHPGVEVKPDDAAICYALGSETRNRASSAGDVEDPFAGTGLDTVDEIASPHGGDSGNKKALVQFGR